METTRIAKKFRFPSTRLLVFVFTSCLYWWIHTLDIFIFNASDRRSHPAVGRRHLQYRNEFVTECEFRKYRNRRKPIKLRYPFSWQVLWWPTLSSSSIRLNDGNEFACPIYHLQHSILKVGTVILRFLIAFIHIKTYTRSFFATKMTNSWVFHRRSYF